MAARVSVIIPHFFTERSRNLLRIAVDLRRSTIRPHEVLVWNNEPAQLLPDLSGTNMTVIQSERNRGCQARLLAAQRATGDYFFFMDNDTTIEAHTITSLLWWAARFPDAMVTLEGRLGRPPGESYKSWPKFRGYKLTAPQPVTMSLGRGELISAPIARRMLVRFPFGPPELMDDLWWSACAAWEGCPIYVVPCQRGHSSLINLPEYGTGASSVIDYEPARNETLAAIRAWEGQPRIWTDAA